jgi:AcrR family transcriptional regulator
VGVEQTKQRLILTAERLFAEHGFDGVTLKQITSEAGQRNASALQYHFGSKVDLVEAIVGFRVPGINERRRQMLAELEKTGQTQQLRPVLEAMVYPLAEQLGEVGQPRYYLGFLAQVYSNPRSGIAQMVPGKLDDAARESGRLARAILTADGLPIEVVMQRLSLLPWQIVHALADFQRVALGRKAISTPLFVSSLIDSLGGALTAPVSQATSSELEHNRATQRLAAERSRNES